MANRLSNQEINELFQHEFTDEHADRLSYMMYHVEEGYTDSDIIHTAQSFVETETYMNRSK